MTGRMVNASVVPGVEPAAPLDWLYHAGIVPMCVVLERLSPHTAVVPGTTIVP